MSRIPLHALLWQKGQKRYLGRTTRVTFACLEEATDFLHQNSSSPLWDQKNNLASSEVVETLERFSTPLDVPIEQFRQSIRSPAARSALRRDQRPVATAEQPISSMTLRDAHHDLIMRELDKSTKRPFWRS